MRQNLKPVAISPSEALLLLGWTGDAEQLRKAASNLQSRNKFPLPIIKVGQKKRVRIIDIEAIVGHTLGQPAEPEQVRRQRGRPKQPVRTLLP